MYTGGIPVVFTQNIRPWLQASVSYLLFRSAKGTEHYLDQRVQLDETQRLPFGFKHRDRYEYKWFRPGNTQTWREMVRWDKPGRGWIRPIALDEVFYSLDKGYMTRNRVAVGDTLPLSIGNLEVMYVHETDNQPVGWSHRNGIWTNLRISGPHR
jgi:hypothetical protein